MRKSLIYIFDRCISLLHDVKEKLRVRDFYEFKLGNTTYAAKRFIKDLLKIVQVV